MRTFALLCAIALPGTLLAADCLPWEQGAKPAGFEAEEKAREYLRNTIRDHRSDARLHAQLGQMLFAGKCYDLALSELLRARAMGVNTGGHREYSGRIRRFRRGRRRRQPDSGSTTGTSFRSRSGGSCLRRDG